MGVQENGVRLWLSETITLDEDVGSTGKRGVLDACGLLGLEQGSFGDLELLFPVTNTSELESRDRRQGIGKTEARCSDQNRQHHETACGSR